MKKYLFFLLLLLVSGEVRAANEISLTFGEAINDANSTWKSQVVTDALEKIKVGDFVVVSFDEVDAEGDVASNGSQYAICNGKGTKIIMDGTKDYFNCKVGDKDFTFTVSQSIYDEIKNNNGLLISYNNLNNLSIKLVRSNEDWTRYKPTDANTIEIMSTPQYIRDWYSGNYCLKTTTDYVGKMLRVVCLETGNASYAYLKKGESGWPSLMSGSDKFSIAGWKYFEVKINDELNSVLKGDGLLIGGNDYFIAGIYVYGNDTTAPAWTEEESDVVDTYNVPDWISGNDSWGSAVIPGSFFEFKSEDGDTNNNTTTKIANTKNNIIRLIFDSTAKGAQCSAKDNDSDGQKPSYIRQRNWDNENNKHYYVNYADCSNVEHYDFELSDAITVFEDWNKPICSAEGVKTGMLSTLLQNGMAVGAKLVKIKQVQIRKSLVSKYITGYAVYSGHHLSDKYWRTVALPYNLTADQIKETFGEDARICELGKSLVSKTPEGKTYHYGITLNFTKISDGEGMNANYPYLVKLAKGKAHAKDGSSYNAEDDVYTISKVKADVRDFQSYEFRTPRFELDALDATKPTEGEADYQTKKNIWDTEQKIKGALTENVYMIFKSTAPVFNISNTDVGNVEIIDGVNERTSLLFPENNGGATSYYLYDNTLYPVLTEQKNLSSGLAYVVFPEATKEIFKLNSEDGTEQQSKTLKYIFDGEGETTGIEDVIWQVKPVKNQNAIYNMNGQLVRKGTSTEGLAKGIYLVAGRKIIVK